MSIFIKDDDVLTIGISYVFDKEGVPHVLSEKDEFYICEPDDVKKMAAPNHDKENQSEIPFNTAIDSILNYSQKDIKKGEAQFRLPNFQDTNRLMSAFKHSGTSVASSDVLEFNQRQIDLLFKSGRLQDENGEYHAISKNNIDKLHPALGNAFSIGLSTRLNR
jgi:hypothetical protein